MTPLPALAAAMALALGSTASVPLARGQAAGGELVLVGSNTIGGRGMNAALAIAGDCAWVGSRDGAAPQALSIGDPTRPVVTGALGSAGGSTARELRAIPSEHVVAVLYYALGAGGSNRLDLFRYRADCTTPGLTGSYDFGGRQPHEFYAWRDPTSPSRVLLFVAFFTGSFRGLEVLDVSDPSAPRLTGSWDATSALGPAAELHSITISDDGRSAYLSTWTGGLLVADTSDFATGLNPPALRLVTPPAAAVRTAGNVHSAVPVPGSALLLLTSEVYPPPAGAGCPYGSATLVDVANAAHPVAVGTLSIPENSPGTCARAPFQAWTSHNATITRDLAVVSWYAGGLNVFDISLAARPSLVATLRPSLGPPPRTRDAQLGGGAGLAWSYPIIRRGLIYYADINQGLVVARYSGPFSDEVLSIAMAEGNSNLGVDAAPPATTSPSALSDRATPSPAGSSRPRPGEGRTALLAGLVVLAAAAIGLLVNRRFRVSGGWPRWSR